MSILTTFNTAYNGLTNSQALLNITSNNISNVNTEGYSRQTAELSAATNGTTSTNISDQAASGLGATIDSIKRNTSSYLDSYYRTENSKYSYYDELSTNAELINTITDQLNGTGLTTALSNFYTAASALSNNPMDTSARTSFISAAQAVCDSFNSTASSLTDLRTTLVGDGTADSLASSTVGSYTDTVNSYLTQLASLNQNIASASASGAGTNSLLDSRDSLLDKLSAYVPTTTTENSNGTVTVSIGGIKVVDGSSVLGELKVSTGTTANPAVESIVSPTSGNTLLADITSVVSSGKIAAVLELGGSSSNLSTGGILTNLNTLASNFASAVNAIQLAATPTATAMDGTITYDVSSCLDNSGSTTTLKQATYNIFVDGTDTDPTIVPGTTASISALNISINNYITNHPSEIAAAIVEGTMATSATSITLTDNTATGDSDAALKFHDLNKTSITGLGDTASNYANTMVGVIGTQISSASDSLDSTSSILDKIKAQQNSVSGVSLDEELANLTLYQRMYESSAKVFGVANEVMQTLLSLAR